MQITVSLEKNLCPAFDLQAQILYCLKAYTNLFCSPEFLLSQTCQIQNSNILLTFMFLLLHSLEVYKKQRGVTAVPSPSPFYFVSNFAKNRVPPFAESFRRCSLSDSQRSANTCKGLPVLSALIGRKCHLKAELRVVRGRCLAGEWARGSREGVSTAESRI